MTWTVLISKLSLFRSGGGGASRIQLFQNLKDRLAERQDYLKHDIKTEPSESYFTKRYHNVSHLKGLVLEQIENSDPLTLKRQEHLLIQKLSTFRHGLNQEPYKFFI